MSEKFYDPSQNIPLRAGPEREKEVFGSAEDPIEFEVWKEHGPKLPREVALQDIRDRQIQSPAMPEREFSKLLRLEVLDRLNDLFKNKEIEEFKYLRFYPSGSSPVDYGHGVDAFFDIVDIEDEIRTITLDVKLDPKKDWKADVPFLFPTEGLDPELDKEQFDGTVERVAEAVIKKYLDPSQYVHRVHYVTKEEIDGSH